MNIKKKFTKINFLHSYTYFICRPASHMAHCTKGASFRLRNRLVLSARKYCRCYEKAVFRLRKMVPRLYRTWRRHKFLYSGLLRLFPPRRLPRIFSSLGFHRNSCSRICHIRNSSWSRTFLFLAHKKEDFKCRRFYSRDSLRQRELPFSGPQAAYVCKLSAIFTPFLSLPG